MFHVWNMGHLGTILDQVNEQIEAVNTPRLYSNADLCIYTHITAVVINVISLNLQAADHPWTTDSFPRQLHFILGLPEDRSHRTGRPSKPKPA